jgi:hypothetical protein
MRWEVGAGGIEEMEGGTKMVKKRSRPVANNVYR